jgi:hypothetical protein
VIHETRRSGARVSANPESQRSIISGFRVQPCGLPRNDKENLLPVIGQDFRAGVAQPGAVLPEAGQHDLIAVIHVRAAIARDIPRAGVGTLLRRCG